MDMPVSLPLRAGITLPTALAAPVEEGMMLPAAARPPRQSFMEGPSTVFWVAVGPDDDVPPLPPDFVPMAPEEDGEDQPLTPQEEFELDPDATRRYTDLQFGKDYQIQ